MKLTFIVVHLTLLCFNEPQAARSVEMRAHLVENGIGVVEVGIDGPLQIFVMGLCWHQSSNDSRCFCKPNLKILCSSGVRSISDGNKALNIFVARLVDGRHCSKTADQGGAHWMTISDCAQQVRRRRRRRRRRRKSTEHSKFHTGSWQFTVKT